MAAQEERPGTPMALASWKAEASPASVMSLLRQLSKLKPPGRMPLAFTPSLMLPPAAPMVPREVRIAAEAEKPWSQAVVASEAPEELLP